MRILRFSGMLTTLNFIIKISRTRKDFAFTLAEILISLAIIGVVAAMTLPNLVNNMQSRYYSSMFKRAYEDIAQVTKILNYENEGNFLTLCSQYDDNCFMHVFASKIKTAKICKNNVIKNGCQSSKSKVAKSHNGLYFEGFGIANRAGFIANSGYSMIFRFHNSECKVTGIPNICGWVVLDINGLKGPNVLGKDIYLMTLFKDGVWGSYYPLYKDYNKANECNRSYYDSGFICIEDIINSKR